MAPDDSIVLVSTVNDSDGTAQVLLIDAVTHKTGIITKEIGENLGAGGLHAAIDNPNVMSWCGRSAGVYKVTVE
jgi:hypothetical protein